MIADDTTNSLVIRATPRDYRQIREALAQLDITRLQVLIEATIAEVTLNGQLRYGVEWFFRYGDVSFAFSRLPSGDVGGNFLVSRRCSTPAMWSPSSTRSNRSPMST